MLADEICDMLGWVADNWSTLVTLLFAGIVAWSAIVSNRLDARLVEAEIDPAMSIYLEPNGRAFRYFDLVVRNVGRGAARNVEFRVESDQPQSNNEVITNLNELGIVHQGLPFFAPGQELRFMIGQYQDLELLGLRLTVRYHRDLQSRSSKEVIASFPLDVRPYAGMTKLGTSYEQTMANSLRDISNTLKRVKTTDALRVRAEREYLFSATLDRWRVRWFGDYVTHRDGGPIKYFFEQIRRNVKSR